MKTSIGFNGKVMRVNEKSYCDCCEVKLPSGCMVASIAADNKWVYVCKLCLQALYIAVYGQH